MFDRWIARDASGDARVGRPIVVRVARRRSHLAARMRGRVRVYARARPSGCATSGANGASGASAGATDGGGGTRARGDGGALTAGDAGVGAWIEDGRVVVVRSSGSVNAVHRRFAVDGAFDERATQREVYAETCAAVLEAATRGERGCVMAYGQTGSGKTYSLLHGGMGEEEEREGGGDGPGIVPRIAVDCFARAATDTRHAYEISCSMAQIYNEQVDDLVTKRSGLRVVPAVDGSGWEIDGLTWTPCRSAEDVLECFRVGRSRLVYAETHMNKQSSRSHCVFQLKIERIERPIESEADVEGDENALVSVEKRLGLLTIVDLAGSERQKKTHNVGARFKEALNINTSLLALGNVVSALAAGHRHIPYRDSQLTKILESSLNGTSRTVLLACVSAEIEHANETANSLDFATRAMRIVTSPEVHSSVVDMDPRKLTQQLRGQCDNEAVTRLMEEVTSLRRALANATKSSDEDVNAMKKSRDSLQHEICSARVQTEVLKKALDQVRTELTTKVRETESVESERSALDARVRALLVKVSTITKECESERAQRRVDSETMRAEIRRLESQLIAERASAASVGKRAEQLGRVLGELRSSNDGMKTAQAKLSEENAKLRSTTSAQRVDHARLSRRYAALEAEHSKLVAERERLERECLTTFAEKRYRDLRQRVGDDIWSERASDLSRRFAEADAARRRHSVSRAAAARRSTERTALLDALQDDKSRVLSRLRDVEHRSDANDERYARDIAATRAEAEAHRRRAAAAARLHALSTDRQLERGIVLTKLARNGKRYERLVRVDHRTGSLESAPLPRRFRPVARRPPVAAPSPRPFQRDDDRGVAVVSTLDREYTIVVAHAADLAWPAAIARRFAPAR